MNIDEMEIDKSVHSYSGLHGHRLDLSIEKLNRELV